MVVPILLALLALSFSALAGRRLCLWLEDKLLAAGHRALHRTQAKLLLPAVLLVSFVCLWRPLCGPLHAGVPLVLTAVAVGWLAAYVRSRHGLWWASAHMQLSHSRPDIILPPNAI